MGVYLDLYYSLELLEELNKKLFSLISALGYLNQNLWGETQASGNCIFSPIQSAKLLKKTTKNLLNLSFICFIYPTVNCLKNS